MCGMVGTRRFKFDVFSNDVNFANEMESTGIAGRVHISEATARFLDDEYLLEEAAPHKGRWRFALCDARAREGERGGGDERTDDGRASWMGNGRGDDH